MLLINDELRIPCHSFKNDTEDAVRHFYLPGGKNEILRCYLMSVQCEPPVKNVGLS